MKTPKFIERIKATRHFNKRNDFKVVKPFFAGLGLSPVVLDYWVIIPMSGSYGAHENILKRRDFVQLKRNMTGSMLIEESGLPLLINPKASDIHFDLGHGPNNKVFYSRDLNMVVNIVSKSVWDHVLLALNIIEGLEPALKELMFLRIVSTMSRRLSNEADVVCDNSSGSTEGQSDSKD